MATDENPIITAEEIYAAAAAPDLYAVPDAPDEPDPVALFHFVNGSVFLSEDYEQIGTVWRASGLFRYELESPDTTPETPMQEVLIPETSLDYISFEVPR